VFTIPVSMKRVYQREQKCYITLYEQIYSRMQLSTEETKRVDPVMCVDTPGIGKRIFEFYFFNRYISDHPELVILLSSWKDFHVQEIFLYNANQSRRKSTRS
jgi:hypothetical protein